MPLAPLRPVTTTGDNYTPEVVDAMAAVIE
jgi:hypothetical protein